jgi:Flp pilus assembly protein TadG
MNTVTRLKTTHSQRQHGAVAITFAFSLLMLFGFMALVFDLGRTYVVRTELQRRWRAPRTSIRNGLVSRKQLTRSKR